MLDFKRLDQLLIYCILFGCFLFLDYYAPAQDKAKSTVVEAVILAPIVEELFFRLIFIGIVFLGIEWVFNNPKSSNKNVVAYFSILGLWLSIVISFPIKDYLEVSVIISFGLAIFLFKILLDKSISIKLIILVIISSIGFGTIHGLTRLLSTSVAGLFFAILFINRTKLEYWHDMTNKQLKIKILIFGYVTVYFIHLYFNLIGRLFSNTLDISWIYFLIIIGIAILVYISQIIDNWLSHVEVHVE